jgi:DNA-binding PadR family transcriptional regulator
MTLPSPDLFFSRLYVLKLVQGSPSTIMNLVDRLRDFGIEKNIRSLRPVLRSLMMASAITAELVEGSGRVYCITDSGRAELASYLQHFDALRSEVPAPGPLRRLG